MQPFEFNSDLILEDSNYVKLNGRLIPEVDYNPISFGSSGEYYGEVVFVGYGFQIDSDDLKWNDYDSIDVVGKWVVIMKNGPEKEEKNSLFSEHSSLYKKTVLARNQGALGVIFISQTKDKKLFPLQFLEGYKDTGVYPLFIYQTIMLTTY